jgi:hypothetical protein
MRETSRRDEVSWRKNDEKDERKQGNEKKDTRIPPGKLGCSVENAPHRRS